MKPIGRIFGESTANEFSFVIFDLKDVKKGDYIKVWNEVDGWILAQVVEVKAISNLNRYDVLEGKETEKEVYIGKAIVIGKREKGVLKVPKTPFSPGEDVFKADEKLIIDALGLKKDGIYLGLLEDTSIKVKLNVKSFVEKHCCILAKTGSGKSYTAAVIIEELIERNVPLLIIDPHGEYFSLKFPNDKPDELEKMKIFDISPKGYFDRVKILTTPNSPFAHESDGILRLDGRNLSAEEIIKLTGITSTNLQAMLYRVIKKLKERGKDYTIRDIITEAEKIKHNNKWMLIGHLEKIADSGLFSLRPTPISSLLEKGKVTILDFRGVPPDHQDLIVSKICSRIFELRKIGRVPPGMIVIEEAHNFIPEKGFGKRVSTQILRTIASEGRKFGLGLMVISQRPAKVDKNVISQCNTQIILKITNPNDINAIKKSIEGLTNEMISEIRRLSIGSAIAVSPELEKPMLVRVRVRKSGGKSIPPEKSKIEKEKKVIKKEGKKEAKKSFFRKIFGL